MERQRIGRINATIPVICLLLASFLINPAAAADEQDAWRALADLQISEAKLLFQEARRGDPENVSLMRGLYLSAALDLDRAQQIAIVDTILSYHPDSPHLLAIYEHVAATLEGWSGHYPLMGAIGESLVANATGALAYVGRMMQLSKYRLTVQEPPVEWPLSMNNVPGFWVCGPFDNESGIALYRPTDVETLPFDSLSEIVGKQGYKSRWAWLDADDLGGTELSQAAEDGPDNAVVMTVFFSLPEDMELLVLPGGAFAGRLLIDGEKVLEATRYRNAVQRESCRLSLATGVHRVTAVVGGELYATSLSLRILDTDYQPIEGFEWLRHGSSAPDSPKSVEAIHPIFDLWEEHVLEVEGESDIRFWRAYLMIYNGHHEEAIEYLEDLKKSGEATPLESVALFDALSRNEEASRAADALAEIASAAECAAVAVEYESNTAASLPEIIQRYQELQNTYPDRLEIDAVASMSPLLEADVQSFLQAAAAVVDKYPESAVIHEVLWEINSETIGDHEEALRQARLYVEKTNEDLMFAIRLPELLSAVGRHDEACKAALELLELQPSDPSLNRAASVFRTANRSQDLLPVIGEFLEKFPVNIDLLSLKHQILQESGRHDEAEDVLREIHRIKPTAAMPYSRLPELHNNVSFDSLFGTVDVMEYWSKEPDSAELRTNNIWTLFEKRQALVLDNGLSPQDIHFAVVLLDEEAVQGYQSYTLGIDVSIWHNSLLTARRLRRGAAPLKAQQDSNNLVFQDLKVGDVIEIRYRFWSAQQGDLWRHWWATYQTQTGYYRHHWEVVIMTERNDLEWATNELAPEPTEDTFGGYRRLVWQGDRESAVNSELWYQPPDSDMMGWIYLSTVNAWDTIGLWYGNITEALLQDNPRSEELADSILTDCPDTPVEKIGCMYSHVLLQIPYHILGFDYDAAVPRNPDQVIANGWGDCKDKSILLISLLREAGIDAWPVLVSTWSSGRSIPIPQFMFDHLITACRIENDGSLDTLYLDVAGSPVTLRAGPSTSIGGQPCLHIDGRSPIELSRIPGAKADDYLREDTMILTISLDGPSPFEYRRNYGLREAGDRREYLKGMAQSELIADFEGGIAESFDVVTKVDSITVDSALTVEPWHREKIYGTFELSIQKAGKITILTPPIYSPIPKQHLAHLYDESSRRGYPVELRNRVEHRRRTLILELPTDLGTPETVEPVHLQDSLWEYSFSSTWDQPSRRLVLTFDYRVEDGECDPEKYDAFIRSLIDVYETPVVFRAAGD